MVEHGGVRKVCTGQNKFRNRVLNTQCKSFDWLIVGSRDEAVDSAFTCISTDIGDVQTVLCPHLTKRENQKRQHEEELRLLEVHWNRTPPEEQAWGSF